MSKWGRKQLPIPDGFSIVEPTLTMLDNELRDRVEDSHEGMRKIESQWPIHQINWQRTRYIHDMWKKHKRISDAVVTYCKEMKLIDGALFDTWSKPGYERLCSTLAINSRNSNFGTVSICRVPKKDLDEDQIVEDPNTGCRGCASRDGVENIFGNKYGERLADIQVAREERAKEREGNQKDDTSAADGGDETGDETGDEEDYGPAPSTASNATHIEAQSSSSEDNSSSNAKVTRGRVEPVKYAPPGKRSRKK
jgi:bud site selection protein 31